jgi:7-cyano-7-deazaguanine reductase
MTNNPLGDLTSYPAKYAPDVLYPIPRWPSRSLLEIDKNIQMYGLDHWQAYEMSWLNTKGKPQFAIGEFFFNAESENIVESKSLKLYLNSHNNESYESLDMLTRIVAADLSGVSRSEVKVRITPLNRCENNLKVDLPGRSIDEEDVVIELTEPDSSLLYKGAELVFDEELYSHCFKSNCPVTGQPDWATFYVQYTGLQIDKASLLRYLCSYRNHQGYHEECAERIYRDIMLRCQPSELFVAMNYLRRGGIDINVYRANRLLGSDCFNPRLIRQ